MRDAGCSVASAPPSCSLKRGSANWKVSFVSTESLPQSEIDARSHYMHFINSMGQSGTVLPVLIFRAMRFGRLCGTQWLATAWRLACCPDIYLAEGIYYNFCFNLLDLSTSSRLFLASDTELCCTFPAYGCTPWCIGALIMAALCAYLARTNFPSCL